MQRAEDLIVRSVLQGHTRHASGKYKHRSAIHADNNGFAEWAARPRPSNIVTRDCQEPLMTVAQPIDHSSQARVHISEPHCPTCGQSIPSERADQVRARIETRERQLCELVSARLKEQFAHEREQLEASARATVESMQRDGAAAIEAVRQDALQKEAAAREEGAKAAEAVAQELVAHANRERLAAFHRYEALRSDHDTIVEQRMEEAREAMEASRTEAVNALKMEYFEEKQRLTGKLEELARRLERKSADERGEAAEVHLFDALKDVFAGDHIRRVEKGTQGADIIHEILHNSRVCGRILYDCKNRSAWRQEYVTKLREDQIAAQAEHAILSTRVFPAGTRQLCQQNGVLIVDPARVVALVEVLRRHIIQLSTLRLSNEERRQKTVALYEFIRSDQCNRLFERIHAQAHYLMKLQDKERKDHDAFWKKQDSLYRGVQKACGDLRSEIDRIIEATD